MVSICKTLGANLDWFPNRTGIPMGEHDDSVRFAETDSLPLGSRFPSGFPLLEDYCSNRYLCSLMAIEIVRLRGPTLKKRKRTKLGKDRRRKHKHWQVTVFYKDGEKFGRVYTDRAKATKFAERQRKSPVVKTARVLQVG
jgi:hypothetical protein